MRAPIPILLFALLDSLHASAATCKRWANAIAACDPGVVSSTNCGDATSWSEGQQRQYNNWRYASNPQKACEKVLRKQINENPNHHDKCALEGPNGPKLFVAGTYAEASAPYTDTTYVCACHLYDPDVATAPDGPTTSADIIHTKRIINLIDLTPRPICSLKPNGPYAHTPLRGFSPAGGKFSDAFRQEVIDKNEASHSGNPVSDVLFIPKASGTGVVSDPYYQLNGSSTMIGYAFSPWEDDPDPDVDPQQIGWPGSLYYSRMQVDHIIPRIDIQGCPCGTNSTANALLISGTLNGQMSNLTSGEFRQAILKKWTNWDGTSALLPPFEDKPNRHDVDTAEAIDADEVADSTDATDTAEMGGCTAGGASGLATGVGFLLLCRRRRRGAARA